MIYLATTVPLSARPPAGTLALSGVSAASGTSAPGDSLYGLKHSTEAARLALAGSGTSRGQLYLEFARNSPNRTRRTPPTGEPVRISRLIQEARDVPAQRRELRVEAVARTFGRQPA